MPCTQSAVDRQSYRDDFSRPDCYTIRSEQAFSEDFHDNLLHHWFSDMDMMEAGFNASNLSKNRERLLHHDVARIFFDAVAIGHHRFIPTCVGTITIASY